MNQQQTQSDIKQRLQPIIKQTSKSQIIISKPCKEQLKLLNEEIDQLDQNNNLANDQKQYQKNEYRQLLLTKIQQLSEEIPIYQINQNIEVSNIELMLYVLKEQLLRDQNVQLMKTSKIYSSGFDSILQVFGQDQYCFKIRNKQLDYDKIVGNEALLEYYLIEFSQNLSSTFQIQMEKIEILGVAKGSFEIYFQIQGKTYDEINQQINNNPAAQEFLNEYCNGKIEYVAYFEIARTAGENYAKFSQKVSLSSDDFNPKYNMMWESCKKKEQRGPPDHRYDYYFPKGCYGFGLNIKKYEENQDWIKMDGNPNEWRILYHGTQNFAVSQIVRNNLVPGCRQVYAADQCIDEHGQTVSIGNGIYFSNDYNVCTQYANYTKVCDKEFAVIIMTRVNPKKIRQSDRMKQKQYFVVNKSEDVRPYRILLHEKQKGIINFLFSSFFK